MFLFSIGSNLNPAKNFANALEVLLKRYQKLALSRIIETAPVGMKSDQRFWNAVGAFATTESETEIKNFFNGLEIHAGRDRNDPARKMKDHVLDLDVLGWQQDFLVKNPWPRESYVQPFFEEVWALLQGLPLAKQPLGERLCLRAGLCCGEQTAWFIDGEQLPPLA